jgi:hypothetical protein
MAHRENTPRATRPIRPELVSERTEASKGAAELALARELGRLIGKHLARQFSECGESGPRDDRRRRSPDRRPEAK